MGAGVAGSLIVAGLASRDDLELICLERAGRHDQTDAGTGLNIGPNAMKCLALHLPSSAERIVANSLPWRSWRVSLTDGTLLQDLSIDEVADNPGVRIRWSELYALLRQPILDQIVFNADLVRAEFGECRRVVWRDSAQREHSLGDIDLLIAADGRYSVLRGQVLGGAETPDFLGVCIFRVLFAAGADCPIDDYEQWFNGPNRLLSFRVPGDLVYCAGTFPIGPDAPVPEAMRRPDALRAAYRPTEGEPSREAGYLIEAVVRHFESIHWARMQDGRVAYSRQPGVLLVGDSAHPMVPTLGQGATQAVEDACVVVDEIKAAVDDGVSLARVPLEVERIRSERVRFAAEFSREATDTLLAGADPVAGTRAKSRPEFRRKLERLYRDVPMPRHAAAASAA